MSKFCCDRMRYDLDQKCPDHPNRFDCPDCLIAETRNGFGLIVHDGGTSYIRIEFCPWCGTNLPMLKD